jgi:1-acyl-sn-glycerol-3-phosphate acyltransferase
VSAPSLPQVSPWLFRQFLGYTRWYLRKHFRQVLVHRQAIAALPGDEPLVFFMNHPCWWDPLLGLLLAGTCFPERTHYGAMDAHALEQYGIFKKLGFFGVERGTTRGAVAFLKMAEQIVSTPHTALWITPHGRYADPRERPVTFLAGTSHVLSRLPRGYVIPIALEYVFWDQRLPYAVAEFGTPLSLADGAQQSPAVWDERLSTAMETAQNSLAQRVMARDPAVFDGMGNLYGWWQSLTRR